MVCEIGTLVVFPGEHLPHNMMSLPNCDPNFDMR